MIYLSTHFDGLKTLRKVKSARYIYKVVSVCESAKPSMQRIKIILLFLWERAHTLSNNKKKREGEFYFHMIGSQSFVSPEDKTSFILIVFKNDSINRRKCFVTFNYEANFSLILCFTANVFLLNLEPR